MTAQGKFLGVDYGTKRIGVAISDDAGEFAFPRAIFDAQLAAQEIALLCKQETLAGIVIGESLATNENQNEAFKGAENFKMKLSKLTDIPIFFEREGFSTVEAHRYQVKAGHRDDSAAAVILQRFLDKTKKTIL